MPGLDLNRLLAQFLLLRRDVRLFAVNNVRLCRNTHLDLLELRILIILEVVHFLLKSFAVRRGVLLFLLGLIDDFLQLDQGLPCSFDLSDDLLEINSVPSGMIE